MDASLVSLLLLIGLLVAVYYDAAKFIIPNWLSASLILLFILWVALADEPMNWPMSLAAAGIVLLVGFGFFALGLMEAGDVKLMVALSLFTGWHELTVMFLLYVSLSGAILSFILLYFRQVLRFKERVPRLLKRKEPVPYGLAIAAGFLALLVPGDIPHLPGLLSAIPWGG